MDNIRFGRPSATNEEVIVAATASIDTETELKIQKGLNKLLAGRTAVMIAHRLSTIRDANKIVVLERGNILEAGTHKALMEVQGFYYNLVKSQYAAMIDHTA